MPDRMTVGLKRFGLWAASFVVVIVVRFLLIFTSHRVVSRMMPKRRSRIAHPAMALRVAEAVRAVARLVPGATCLTQAFAVQFLLAVRGYASDVQIGVKRAASGEIEAHAWLMSGHCIATGGSPAEIAEYVPLAELPLR